MASLRFISYLQLQIEKPNGEKVERSVKFGDSYKVKAICIIDDDYRNIYFDNEDVARGVHKDVFSVSNNVEFRDEKPVVKEDVEIETLENIREENDAEYNSEA
jgi:hypothetical protein